MIGFMISFIESGIPVALLAGSVNTPN